MRATPAYSPTQIPEPPLARFLFADTRIAWLWLIIRVYVGWEWLTAGWGKIQNPAWFGASAGSALTVTGSVNIPPVSIQPQTRPGRMSVSIATSPAVFRMAT